MGGMMGVMGTMGAWILLWILLALAVGVTGGIVIARSLHTQGSTGSPEMPPPNRLPCRKPKMPYGCDTPTARSAGRSTCKGRSSWKTDHADGGRRPKVSVQATAHDGRKITGEWPGAGRVRPRTGSAAPSHSP